MTKLQILGLKEYLKSIQKYPNKQCLQGDRK